MSHPVSFFPLLSPSPPYQRLDELLLVRGDVLHRRVRRLGANEVRHVSPLNTLRRPWCCRRLTSPPAYASPSTTWQHRGPRRREHLVLFRRDRHRRARRRHRDGVLAGLQRALHQDRGTFRVQFNAAIACILRFIDVFFPHVCVCVCAVRLLPRRGKKSVCYACRHRSTVYGAAASSIPGRGTGKTAAPAPRSWAGRRALLARTSAG